MYEYNAQIVSYIKNLLVRDRIRTLGSEGGFITTTPPVLNRTINHRCINLFTDFLLNVYYYLLWHFHSYDAYPKIFRPVTPPLNKSLLRPHLLITAGEISELGTRTNILITGLLRVLNGVNICYFYLIYSHCGKKIILYSNVYILNRYLTLETRYQFLSHTSKSFLPIS